MAVEVERLMVSVEARVTQLERGMDRAAAKTRGTMRQIERDTDRMATRVQASFSKAGAAAGASFKAGLAGIAAGAIGAISIEGVTKSIADLAKLQDVAERTGVSTKQIQEFNYAVGQSGGTIEDVEKGLQKFAVNLSKAGQGSGDLAKILQANNVALKDQEGALRPVGDLLGEVADLIKNATSEQDKLNIATAAFGRGAAQGLVLALDGGKKGLAAYAAEAQKAGIVLDASVIKKAAELDDQIDKTLKQIEGLGKALLVEFAGPAIAAGLNATLDQLKEIRSTIEAIRNADFGKLGDLLFGKSGADAGFKIARPYFYPNAAPPGAGDAGELAGLEKRQSDTAARIAALQASPFAARAGLLIGKLKADLQDIEDRIKNINANPIKPVASEAIPLAPIEVVGNAKPTVMPGEGGDNPKLKGLTGDFADAVQGMIAAAKAAGHDISVVSGKRSVERQAELFAAAVKKYGSVDAARKWVAPPGSSFHNKGTAADLGYGGAGMKGGGAQAAAARAWAHQNAGQFGLTFPMGHEPWHVEPQGQRGRAGGSLTPNEETAEAASKKAREDAEQRSKDAMESLRESDARTAGLLRESKAINQTAYAKAFAAEKARLLNDIEKEGAVASPEQLTAIDQKSAAYARQSQQLEAVEAAAKVAKTAQEDLAQAKEEMAGIGADAVKGFVADLKAGKSAADALRNALDRILTKLTDNLIDSLFKGLLSGGAGGGGILSLLSGFGGARAAGGPVQSGKAYLVGEKGPELFAPGRSGTIIPRVPTVPRVADARASRSTISPNVRMTIDLRGANGDATIERISRQAAAQAGEQAYKMAVRDGQRMSGKTQYNREVLGQAY